MNDNSWDLPESQEAIEATEAVCNGGRKRKTFFEQHMFPLKGDSPKERRRKILFDLFALVAVGALAFLVVWAGVLPFVHWLHERDLPGLRPEAVYGYECRICSTPWVDEAEYCAFCAEHLSPDDPDHPDNLPEAGYRYEISPRVRIGRYSFEELHAINPNVVAWLEVPGADISLPVTQAHDNEHYVHRNLRGQPSRHGNPFFDFRNRV
ncbi:MAG: hypothetical protein FWB76_07315, partial [Oscillospiraceae bacterium]|nr:hypothetical protein [Oscillospiraceae bacterium]